MQTHKIIAAAALTLSFAGAPPAWADRDHGASERRHSFQREGHGEHHRTPHRRQDGNVPGDRHASPTYAFHRHSHHAFEHRSPLRRAAPHHHASSHSHVVAAVPHGHRLYHHHGVHYHVHAGRWYRPDGARFLVVAPPVGIVVPVLPRFHTTIWFGGIPYYYADHIYYVWREEHRGYVVTEPPEASPAELAAATSGIFVYPKNGQSEAQVSNDRYECHRWAADQSGFDPSQPNDNVTTTQRSDYARATKACLEARGYSVQ